MKLFQQNSGAGVLSSNKSSYRNEHNDGNSPVLSRISQDRRMATQNSIFVNVACYE